MDVVSEVGIAVAAGCLLLVALFARRLLISRSDGTVEVSMRLYRRRRGRGWSLGVVRFAGDRLLWYRMFSLAPRPNRVLSRQDLTVVARRNPSGKERLALMAESVVVECATREGPLELAMDTAALTGFLAWLEAAAPGADHPPYATP